MSPVVPAVPARLVLTPTNCKVSPTDSVAPTATVEALRFRLLELLIDGVLVPMPITLSSLTPEDFSAMGFFSYLLN